MTYYVEHEGRIVLHDIDRQRLENTLMLMPQFCGLAISETDNEIIDCNFVGTEKHFEKTKESKLAELDTAFAEELDNAHCNSSAGFEINADETANRNISSLIYALETTGQETAQFCAFDNTFHEVSYSRLKSMKLDIINHTQALYRRKWNLREQINAAKTIDDVNAVEIDFAQEGKLGH